MIPYIIGFLFLALFVAIMMIPTMLVVRMLGPSSGAARGVEAAPLAPAPPMQRFASGRAIFLSFCLVLSLAYALLAFVPFFLNGIHQMPVEQIERVSMSAFPPFSFGLVGNLLQALLLYVSSIAVGLHALLFAVVVLLFIVSQRVAPLRPREVVAIMITLSSYVLNLLLTTAHRPALLAWLFD